jgi:uncharacterized protein
MTTTATPASAPPASRPPVPRRPDRSWRRRVLRVLAAAAVLGIAWTAVSGGSSTHDMTATAPLTADANGTYGLEDGAQLTVWGSAQHPVAEVDGRVSRLVADGQDRYRAFDGTEVLRFVRDGGDVTGVHLERTDGPNRTGSRVEIHREEPVTFRSGEQHLAGTVFTPVGDGPHPAVVIVHGAEFADRDTYRLLASHLARNGVTALIYDKRGTGESTGSAKDATFDDLRDDALAGVTVLTARPDVRRDRVGVLGFSQGAWVVAKAAQHSDDIAFVIAYSPSGFSPADQQAWLHGSMLAARGFGPAAMRIADRAGRMLYSSVDLVDAGIIPPIPHVPGFWFHALDLHLDTAALWKGVHQPALLAWGELDCQVPAHDSRTALTAALREGGNPDVTTVVLPGADHSFAIVAPCGNETGLAHHGGHKLADGYLHLAPTWINQHANDAPPTPRPEPVSTPEDGVLGWHLDPPAPAPWYGSIGAQLAAVTVLLALFASLARSARRSRGQRADTGRPTARLLAATAAAGLLATLTVLAAITEIAMLGDTHAAFLLGGPTVQSSSLLMQAARATVLLTVLAGTAAAALDIRTARSHRGKLLALIATSSGLLLAWAGYWGLAPLS